MKIKRMEAFRLLWNFQCNNIAQNKLRNTYRAKER